MKISRHRIIRRTFIRKSWRVFRESQDHCHIVFLRGIRSVVRKRHRCKPSHTPQGKLRAARAGH